jgi:hypothetical protein
MSCDDSNENALTQQETSAAQEVDMSDFYAFTSDEELSRSAPSKNKSKTCHSMNVLNRQLNENPGLYKKMYDIELQTRKAIAQKGKPSKPGGGGGTPPPTPYAEAVTIPVIVNVLEDPSHPVTSSHISSQIAILNEDFNNNNPNTSSAPSEFVGDVADVNITFTLAGVVRKTSDRATWGTSNAMKSSTSETTGGIDATTPTTHLNIWVCEIGGGILGYAQFPGGAEATDGVVIGSDFMGSNNAGGVYGDGRTATHEVGHWLNLRHIWGDGRCRQDDFVADTPSSDAPNYGCPSYPTYNCKSNDMTMNYMDYVYDDCMYMFTNGQNDRMRSTFLADGGRDTFVQ